MAIYFTLLGARSISQHQPKSLNWNHDFGISMIHNMFYKHVIIYCSFLPRKRNIVDSQDELHRLGSKLNSTGADQKWL